MTLDDLKNADWLKTLIYIVVGVFLLRIFLPIITIVAIAALGLFLVLVILDTAMGGSSLMQISDNIMSWFNSFFKGVYA